jgi:hypothetical protein
MSSLIAFSRSQLDALADAEGMTRLPPQSAPPLQPLLTPMATASASASNSGELKSLPLSTATRQIAQHKSRQLAARGGTSKPPFHRGSSWRTKKPVQFGTRARPPFADRSGRSGGGNGGAGSNSGGRGGHGGNGHRGRRGSPSGRPPRGGFSPRPSPRFHTNNVSVPEHGDDAAVRQLQGLFDFSKRLFITLPEYTEGTKFQYNARPPISAITCATTRCHLSRCTPCSPTHTMTTSCRSKRS